MQILFRELDPHASGVPAAGEVELWPWNAAMTSRLALATLVLEQGVAALRCGPGAPERLVAPIDPTLDDMLAVTFVLEIVAGRALPDGTRDFARYAALVREGHRPARVPLSASLEGMFLALRNLSGQDLRDAGQAARLLDSWQVVARRLLAAAAAGEDPFAQEFFPAKGELARERMFLDQDLEVYRHDVARGEVWRVSFAGAPPGSRALILSEPKSILCKYWSRDPTVNGSGSFVLLGVKRGAGNWVFSTDPVHRLSLAPLHAQLEAVERAPDAGWFDGQRFGGTLIAAPRDGTRLTDEQVLAIVKRWSAPRRSRRNVTATWTVATMLVTAALVAIFAFPPWRAHRATEAVASRGARPVARELPAAAMAPVTLYSVAIGISRYRDPALALDFAAADAHAVSEAFAAQEGVLFEKVERQLLVDQQADKKTILATLKAMKRACTQHDLAILSLAGHGERGEHGRFFFAPYDYDATAELSASAISWDDFREYLDDLPCPVLVIMDACYSGEVTKDLRAARAESELGRAVEDALRSFVQVGRGIVVMAASLSREKARENQDWKHGALTLAFLEAVRGERLYLGASATPLPHARGAHAVVTLKDVDFYVTQRVKELVHGEQSVVTNHTGDVAVDQIPLAVMK